MHYVLFYDYVPDIEQRRTPHRPEHLEILKRLHQEGKLLMAGAFTDPLDSAALVFVGDTPADAEAFVKADPYVKAGLVTRWRIRPWSIVIGA